MAAQEDVIEARRWTEADIFRGGGRRSSRGGASAGKSKEK